MSLRISLGIFGRERLDEIAKKLPAPSSRVARLHRELPNPLFDDADFSVVPNHEEDVKRLE
jgi:hypothetical protein